MVDMLKRYWSDDSGQGLVEYVLIIALVAIGLTVVLLFFRDNIANVFNVVSGDLQTAPTAAATT